MLGLQAVLMVQFIHPGINKIMNKMITVKVDIHKMHDWISYLGGCFVNDNHTFGSARRYEFWLSIITSWHQRQV